ncbi:MAG: hypothetical protein WEB87_01215, partial [Bacteriovoracaceae bacterium]
MVKAFVSFVFFIALIMAGGVGKALERSFALKEKQINLGQIPYLLGNVARLLNEPAKLKVTPRVDAEIENLSQDAVSMKSAAVAPLELSAMDFIPSNKYGDGKEGTRLENKKSRPEF